MFYEKKVRLVYHWFIKYCSRNYLVVVSYSFGTLNKIARFTRVFNRRIIFTLFLKASLGALFLKASLGALFLKASLGTLFLKASLGALFLKASLGAHFLVWT